MTTTTKRPTDAEIAEFLWTVRTMIGNFRSDYPKVLVGRDGVSRRDSADAMQKLYDIADALESAPALTFEEHNQIVTERRWGADDNYLTVGEFQVFGFRKGQRVIVSVRAAGVEG